MGHPSNALREAVSIERHEGLGKTTLTWQKLGGVEESDRLVRKDRDFSRSLTAFFSRLRSFIIDIKREDSEPIRKIESPVVGMRVLVKLDWDSKEYRKTH